MVPPRILLAFFACALDLGSCAEMDCGVGVQLCGVLTLQTGLGRGVYSSKTAKVHGLWPETGSYGDSKCIKPKNSADPTEVYDCYVGDSNAAWFQNHEWEKHGRCAGVQDANDFFKQVCGLASAPVRTLQQAKDAGKDFDAMAQALRDQKYPVWSLDQENDQVMLSACAGSNGQWVLATTSEMVSKCGGSSPVPGPSPAPPAPGPSPTPPAPSPSSGSCQPGRKGPQCSSDNDCKGLAGCVRCAHSGFCTDQPLYHVHARIKPMMV